MRSSKIVRILALAVQFGLGICLLWWLITNSNINMSQLIQRFSRTSGVPLVLGILCFATTMVLSALRFYLFLPATVSFSYLIGTTLFQNALLTFVPWRLGEMSYPLLLRKDYNVPLVSSGAVIMAIRLIDLLVVLTVAIVGGGKLGLDTRWVMLAVVGGLSLLSGAALVMWRTGPPALLQRFTLALRPLLQPRRLAAFLTFSVSIFTLTTVQSAFIFRAVALTVSLPDVALLNSLTLLTALLPIHPPGGWGTVDSIQLVILERLHYSRVVSSPAILVAHSLFTLLILTGGSIGWLLRGKSRPDFKAGLEGSLTRID